MTLTEQWRKRAAALEADAQAASLLNAARWTDKAESIRQCADELEAWLSQQQRLAEMTAHRDAWVKWIEEMETSSMGHQPPQKKLEWEDDPR